MRKSTTPANADTFNLSISDLMAGLLGIFILVLCYYILTFNAMNAELKGNNDKREEILVEIKQELQNSNINIEIDTKRGILRLPEGSVFFPLGSANTDANGVTVLLRLSEVIETVIQKPQYQGKIETIFIEGHTDNIPMNPYNYYHNNWNLSTARAVEVWHLMFAHRPLLAQLQNSSEPPENIFSCSGYADTRPIADNSTESGRTANRRIDIRFTMTPPKEGVAQIVNDVQERLK